MATCFPLPKLGTNREQGEVVPWLVAHGDAVTRGQPMVEVETDKNTVELESTASGGLLVMPAPGADRLEQIPKTTT